MKKYQQTIQALAKKVQLSDMLNNDRHIRSFAFFVANFHYFGLNFTKSTLLHLYQRARVNQLLAIHDQECQMALKAVNTERWSGLLNQWKEPGVIATFHLGSYRLLNQWFMRQGIPFVLLVSQEVYSQQALLFNQIYQRLRPAGGGADFQLLVAEDRMVLKKLIDFLKKGYYVFIYADGDSGCLPKPKQQGTTEITFFERCLPVHHGLASISFLTKKPVYPVLVPRTDAEVPFLQIDEPIWPDQAASRNAYAQQCMQALFNFLEQQVRKRHWQWENWLIPPKWRENQYAEQKENAQLLNGDVLTTSLPYRTNRHCYLLDTKQLNSYVITETAYHVFVNALKSCYL
ncbi:hypothetical protein GCM10023231_00530 [Olivibacter ginsenosidimutans]|uniref:Lysophospholipid acyltransferase family protein n=1 Tax=Olivibacter ginsenosidimutans TaxID=1176537 RepID=A0ABP9AAW5_9SPHI